MVERNEILFHLGKVIQISLLWLKGQFQTGEIIDDYLSHHRMVKLQLGSGLRLLRGWLNTDCSLCFKSDCFLDATKLFPFRDQTFNFIFSEHLIEHLNYEQGVGMLKECYRVLKRGGSVRIACPDLKIYTECFALNRAMHSWGHKFLYDFDTVKKTMELAGFVGVTRFKSGVSNIPALRGLESRDKARIFETMILQARKTL
jgi:SAM-dependent methyltransferase